MGCYLDKREIEKLEKERICYIENLRGVVGFDENDNLQFVELKNINIPDTINGNKLSETDIRGIAFGHKKIITNYLMPNGERKDINVQMQLTSKSYTLKLSEVKKLTRAEVEKIDALRQQNQQNNKLNRGPKL